MLLNVFELGVEVSGNFHCVLITTANMDLVYGSYVDRAFVQGGEWRWLRIDLDTLSSSNQHII